MGIDQRWLIGFSFFLCRSSMVCGLSRSRSGRPNPTDVYAKLSRARLFFENKNPLQSLKAGCIFCRESWVCLTILKTMFWLINLEAAA